MPTRLLREGIISSRQVAALSDQAEILYRRLMSIVDDYGRHEADIDLIRAKCFPYQMDRWTVKRIVAALTELGESPLVTVYHGAGKNLLQVNNFGQRIQSKPKYPPPDGFVDSKEEPLFTVNHGGSRKITVQSDTYSESDTKSNTESESGVLRPADAETPKPRLVTDSAKGTRFSEPGIPKPWLDFAVEQCAFTPVKALAVFESFADYWRARPGKDGRKADWLATWRNWCRQEVQRQPPRSGMLPFQPREGIAEQMTRVVRERIERGERPI